MFRRPLLISAASLWIINDPIQTADAIVVLGGGLEVRPFAAASLFKDHAADKILIMQSENSPAIALGVERFETDKTLDIILRNRVPLTNIITIGAGVTSTFDEAIAVRGWAATNHIKCIIIPTDLFHTRRARAIFRKELKSLGIQIKMRAVNPLHYTATNWWSHEEGLIAFQNEIIKSAYYHLKY